jgi:hypothetical protein
VEVVEPLDTAADVDASAESAPPPPQAETAIDTAATTICARKARGTAEDKGRDRLSFMVIL